MMNKFPEIDIIIPVAGKGERLMPHTRYYQKCLLPVAGKPILNHIIKNFEGLNINKIKLITGHHSEQVEDFVMKRSDYKYECIVQEEQLGLGHAIKLGLEKSDKPVLIVLGDSIFNINYKDFCSSVGSKIGVLEVKDPERYGIIEIRDKKIVKFVEKPKKPKSNLAQIGIYYIDSQINLLESIEYIIKKNIKKNGEYQLPDAFQNMLENRHFFEYEVVKEYLDCGVIETMLNSNKVLLSQNSKNYISQKSIVKNSNLEYCTISDGCYIENSNLYNVILLNNTKIINQELSNKIIGCYSYDNKEKDIYDKERNVY